MAVFNMKSISAVFNVFNGQLHDCYVIFLLEKKTFDFILQMCEIIRMKCILVKGSALMNVIFLSFSSSKTVKQSVLVHSLCIRLF